MDAEVHFHSFLKSFFVAFFFFFISTRCVFCLPLCGLVNAADPAYWDSEPLNVTDERYTALPLSPLTIEDAEPFCGTPTYRVFVTAIRVSKHKIVLKKKKV